MGVLEELRERWLLLEGDGGGVCELIPDDEESVEAVCTALKARQVEFGLERVQVSLPKGASRNVGINNNLIPSQ